MNKATANTQNSLHSQYFYVNGRTAESMKPVVHSHRMQLRN